MIAEIVSNGMLSLPNTLAVVGESSLWSPSFFSSSQRHRTSSHPRRVLGDIRSFHSQTAHRLQAKPSQRTHHGFVFHPSPTNHSPTLIASPGDAGYILFGPIGREVLLAGTIIFAITCVVSKFLQLSSFTPPNSL
jgi:hypothetical protein